MSSKRIFPSSLVAWKSEDCLELANLCMLKQDMPQFRRVSPSFIYYISVRGGEDFLSPWDQPWPRHFTDSHFWDCYCTLAPTFNPDGSIDTPAPPSTGTVPLTNKIGQANPDASYLKASAQQHNATNGSPTIVPISCIIDIAVKVFAMWSCSAWPDTRLCIRPEAPTPSVAMISPTNRREMFGARQMMMRPIVMDIHESLMGMTSFWPVVHFLRTRKEERAGKSQTRSIIDSAAPTDLIIVD